MDAKEIYERAQAQVDEIESVLKQQTMGPSKSVGEIANYALRILRMQGLMLRELARMIKAGD